MTLNCLAYRLRQAIVALGLACVSMASHAHDSLELIFAGAIVLLLPIPALWIMTRRRPLLFVAALLGLWAASIGLLMIESPLAKLVGVSLQSGLLSTILLVSPNVVLLIHLIHRALPVNQPKEPKRVDP